MYFNRHFYNTKNEIMYDIWIAPLFLMGTGGGPLAKPTERMEGGKGDGRDDQEVQSTVSISSKSESLMFGMDSWSFLASIISAMKGSLHCSSDFIIWYFTLNASSGTSSLTSDL